MKNSPRKLPRDDSEMNLNTPRNPDARRPGPGGYSNSKFSKYMDNQNRDVYPPKSVTPGPTLNRRPMLTFEDRCRLWRYKEPKVNIVAVREFAAEITRVAESKRTSIEGIVSYFDRNGDKEISFRELENFARESLDRRTIAEFESIYNFINADDKRFIHKEDLIDFVNFYGKAQYQ